MVVIDVKIDDRANRFIEATAESAERLRAAQRTRIIVAFDAMPARPA
jgi:hypothetical protein